MTTPAHVAFRRVALPIDDPDAAAHFLGDVLGVAVHSSEDSAIVVAHGGSAVRFQTLDALHPAVLSFVVDEDHFESLFGRVLDRRLPYWADHEQRRPSEINHRHHGRGLYIRDPCGQLVEITTSLIDDSLP